MELSCRNIDGWGGHGEALDFCFARPDGAQPALGTIGEMNRLLFEGMHDGCILFDPDGTILRANSSAVRILGYEHADCLIGRSMAWDIFVSLEEYMNFLWLLEEKGAVDDRIIRFKCKYHGKITIECNARQLFDKPGKPSCIVGTFRDISERVRIDERINSLVEEKNTLLKAVNHRIGNNLQIISSMIDLQSEPGLDESARQFIQECQCRIRSVAMVHSQLSRTTDCVALDFGDYLENLVGSIFRSCRTDSRISLSVEAESLKLGMDHVIHCGLIVNELVSNSLQHAFPDGRKGKLTLRMHRDNDERIHLVVTDDGIGMPPGLDFRDTCSLGFQLVKFLVDQIQGEIELENIRGTTVRIAFSTVR